MSIVSGGKRASINGSVAAWISAGESSSAKSRTGCGRVRKGTVHAGTADLVYDIQLTTYK